MDLNDAPLAPAARSHVERLKAFIASERGQELLNFAWVWAICWGAYLLSGALKWTYFNAHVALADAMLHGRFYLVDPPRHYEMTVWEGKHYVAYGIAPTLLMLPFVAIAGPGFHQAAFCAAMGGLSVALWWAILGKLEVSGHARTWLTALYGFGSLFWFYSGQNGNTWSIMHVTVSLGLMLGIWACLGRQRAWLAGLGFGLAVLSRQTVFLSLPFFVGMLWRDERATGGASIWRKAVEFALSLGALMGFNAFYNYARFGSLTDNGYARVIRDNLGELPHGNFGLYYLLGNLQGYFVRIPDKLDHFPWFDPTMDGFSIFISMPAIAFVLFARYRQRINWLALLAIVPIFGFYLVYHWSGYAQFGRRYTLDFLPFVMVLIASGVRNKVSLPLIACVLFGALVELWGLFWWGIKGW